MENQWLDSLSLSLSLSLFRVRTWMFNTNFKTYKNRIKLLRVKVVIVWRTTKKIEFYYFNNRTPAFTYDSSQWLRNNFIRLLYITRTIVLVCSLVRSKIKKYYSCNSVCSNYRNWLSIFESTGWRFFFCFSSNLQFDKELKV